MNNIEYLGWSGFHIRQNDAEDIYIDPPKGTRFADQDIIILITHGHPEHLGGTLDHVREKSNNFQTTIIASKTVNDFYKKEKLQSGVIFTDIQPLEVLSYSNKTTITCFEWTHMPLLPPGIGAAVRHIWRIATGFKHMWRILKMSLNGPKWAGKMLGYALKLNGQNIIIYGEGLHRHCKIEDVTFIGAIAPASTILVASEPEDIDDLPALVAASGAANAILYEPHRPWRDLFKLPHIDLKKLAKTIAAMGIQTTTVG